MRAIVTGGGTGGHIYPAIAIADKIKEKEPDSEILYIGNYGCIEEEIVPKAGYSLRLVDANSLNRSSIKALFRSGMDILKGISQAKRIMKDFKPEVVIGTGGFVCVPVIIAAHSYGARCYLHEQNAFAGTANKMLESRARRIFLGFRDAAKYFKNEEKLKYVGNPVRRAFYDADRQLARKRLGIAQDDFVIFLFGGSQGSEILNDVGIEILKTVNRHKGMSFIFGTGKRHCNDVKKTAEENGIILGDNIMIKDYIDNMPDYLAASDIVISRSGALSVAETTVCGKASIMVPFAEAAGNHQYYNAKAVADNGGCYLIEEKDLDREDVIRKIMKLYNDRELLDKMSKASLECAPVDTCDMIYSEIRKDER